MKNLLKDERAVAYLLLVGVGVTIVVVGMAFMFTSDFVDSMLSATTYDNTPLEGQMDAESEQGGDLLFMLFKISLIPSLIVIMYFAFVMSQKPVKQW